jgi:hypothetical protein
MNCWTSMIGSTIWSPFGKFSTRSRRSFKRSKRTTKRYDDIGCSMLIILNWKAFNKARKIEWRRLRIYDIILYRLLLSLAIGIWKEKNILEAEENYYLWLRTTDKLSVSCFMDMAGITFWVVFQIVLQIQIRFWNTTGDI